jgi:plastocyanin domain-containing protein
MKNALAIVAAAVIIGGAFMFATRSPQVASTDNVSVENGKQVVEIKAEKNYAPALTSAKPNMPTVIRMETNGTFNCTSIVRIPSIGYQQTLPLSGSTDIEIPPQQPGAKVTGVCSMGMYSFEVDFEG